jgi:beta-phosphoglucomutase
VAVASLMAARALLFDFNGTLSDDEPILFEIWRAIFEERGRPLAREEYFGSFAGLADPEIAALGLGLDGEDLAAVMDERVRRYRERVADGACVRPEMRAAIQAAAARVPVGVVSGAARADIELVLGAAGLDGVFGVVVSAEDVASGKPDPEGYLRAAAALGVARADAVVLEDSEAGVRAAKAAGMRCVALLGTVASERLADADEVVERVDEALVERLLG